MANYVRWNVMTTYDTSGLTGSFAALNGSGLANAAKILIFYNASDVAVTISFNGTDNHLIIPATGTLVVDLQTNADKNLGGDGHWQIRDGQVIYGKGSAGSGNLYISSGY